MFHYVISTTIYAKWDDLTLYCAFPIFDGDYTSFLAYMSQLIRFARECYSHVDVFYNGNTILNA